MKVFRPIGICLLAGIVLTISSCGGDRKSVYAAKGRVVDSAGKGLAGAMLIFHPVDDPTNAKHKPAATADKEGNFTLTTYTQDDGAPAGEYVVTIEWRPIPRSPMEPEQPDRLKGKYRDMKTSPFKATIKTAANELEPFKIPAE